MSRSSTALKRLGIAGLAAVTIGAGLPTLFASSASAADATTLSISPAPGQAAAGVCQAFTVTATDANGAPATYTAATPTLNIELTENPVTATQNVQFCDPVTDVATGAGTGTTTSTTARGTATFSRTAPITATTPTRATFGVVGLEPGGANIRVFIDATGSGTAGSFDAGETTSTTSTTFTAGGTGNAAQDAVRSISETGTVGITTAGDVATTTVQVRNASGNPVRGVTVSFRVTAGPNGPQAAVAPSTTGTPGASGSAVSNNDGEATFTYQTNGVRFGSDTIQVFVNQTSGATAGPDAGEPTLIITKVIAQQPTTDQSLVRTIVLSPKTVNTVAGARQVFTALVTTATGQPVAGTPVTFREEGPGRFLDGSSAVTVNTDRTGRATATTSSVAGEAGTQVIIASVPATGNQTGSAAGAPAGVPAAAPAGNNSDSATQFFTAASPSPSATATPSPSATGTATCGIPVVSLDRATIIATGSSQVTVSGLPANSIIELFAYTRPSTAYRVVRRAEVSGTSTTFRVVPPANTRLYAKVAGCPDTFQSPSVVLNVRTALSITAQRNGTRNYTFRGDSLPARPGGLIVSLYRVTSSGSQILTAQTRASATTGDWVINRRFTGSGRFGFVVRTGQDLQNAPGASNIRPTAIF